MATKINQNVAQNSRMYLCISALQANCVRNHNSVQLDSFHSWHVQNIPNYQRIYSDPEIMKNSFMSTFTEVYKQTLRNVHIQRNSAQYYFVLEDRILVWIGPQPILTDKWAE